MSSCASVRLGCTISARWAWAMSRRTGEARVNKIRRLRIHFCEAPVLLASIRLAFVIMDMTLSSYAGVIDENAQGYHIEDATWP